MLRLSRETDYSLLAMMYIAARPDGELAYRRDIAAHYNIPKEFLAKVLQKLARHGLIRSYRGTQGGYQLARRPEQITLVDVLEATEGPVTLVECQGEPHDCRQQERCTVQTTLLDIQQRIRQVLGAVSLQDMTHRLTVEDRLRLIDVAARHRDS